MTDQKKIKLPAHSNPKSPNRAASAAYNFVPLPNKVVTVADGPEQLPDHDRCSLDRLSGWFDVILTTMSPLYIRCGQSRSDFGKDSQKPDFSNPSSEANKKLAQFFYSWKSSRPVIPGSSLRGLLRSLLEIASYGKVDRVTEKKLFFRTVDDTAVGDHYRSRMADKVQAGFLQRCGDSYVIKPCQALRVPIEFIGGGDRYDGRGPKCFPKWDRQYKPIWIVPDLRAVTRVSFKPEPILKEARLVITGDMRGKKKEFAFLLPDIDTQVIPVPEDIINRFHDDDQLTQWQEGAFGVNKPSQGARTRKGFLMRSAQEWEQPIFYLIENEKLTFIGRACKFRLPYANCPKDLVPEELRQENDIDFADALFGYVRSKTGQNEHKQGSKARGYGGRVTVSDANLEPDQSENVWFSDTPIIPKILAAPKPTAFQHYLVQSSEFKRSLNHYDTPLGTTALRGFKQYWHQAGNGGIEMEEFRRMLEDNKDVLQNDTQHTLLKPVKPGVGFRFKIHFDNLSEEELGALSWILHPRGLEGKQYCHKIGMGKALGLGSVQLNASLTLVDRSERYKRLFSAAGWNLGIQNQELNLADRSKLDKLTASFEKYIMKQLGLPASFSSLYQIPRIAMLLKMLEWPGKRSNPIAGPFIEELGQPNTRQMTLEEFKDRRVLPDPSAFGGLEGVFSDVPLAAAGRSNPMAAAIQTAKQVRDGVTLAESGKAVAVSFKKGENVIVVVELVEGNERRGKYRDMEVRFPATQYQRSSVGDKVQVKLKSDQKDHWIGEFVRYKG